MSTSGEKARVGGRGTAGASRQHHDSKKRRSQHNGRQTVAARGKERHAGSRAGDRTGTR